MDEAAYVRTCDAKRARRDTGHVQMGASALAFCQRIEAEFDTASVLNVHLDQLPHGQPRLWVIFEYVTDAAPFLQKNGVLLNERKQARLRKIAIETGLLDGFDKVDQSNALILVDPFEPEFRERAVGQIGVKRTDALSEELPRSLGSPEIWRIMLYWGVVIVFFETVEDVARAEADGTAEAIRAAMQTEIEPFDEFGYFARTPLRVSFDSREVFETKYQGNWRAYFD